MENIVEQSVAQDVLENQDLHSPEPCVGGKLVAEMQVDPTNPVGDSTDLGTFKDASQVYKAYEALRRDYTQRCQELARLKSETSNNASVAGKIAVAENFDSSVIKSEDDIVREYLFGVTRKTHAPIVMGQAALGGAQPDGAKSLNAATNAAKQFFGGKL